MKPDAAASVWELNVLPREGVIGISMVLESIDGRGDCRPEISVIQVPDRGGLLVELDDGRSGDNVIGELGEVGVH